MTYTIDVTYSITDPFENTTHNLTLTHCEKDRDTCVNKIQATAKGYGALCVNYDIVKEGENESA